MGQDGRGEGHVQEILFERGFIPNSNDRTAEELNQVAN